MNPVDPKLQRVGELFASMNRIAAAEASIEDGSPTFSVLPFRVTGSQSLTIEPCDESDPNRAGWGVYERSGEDDRKASLVSVHPTLKEASNEADRLDRWDGAPFNLQYQGENYTYEECLYDFAGNWKNPGCWADLWHNASGQQIVTLGGGWEFYVQGGDKQEVPAVLVAQDAETAVRLFKTEPLDHAALNSFLSSHLEPRREGPEESTRNPVKP